MGADNECYRCGGLASPLFPHTQEDCLDQLLEDKKMLRSNLDHSDAESKWMRREIERVGDALFANARGEYTGTEDDLHAVGQFVEGVCETTERMMELEAENTTLRKMLMEHYEYEDELDFDLDIAQNFENRPGF